MRQEQLLETMQFWTQARARANLPLNAALFTLAVAQSEATKMVNALEETAEKEPDVKMPDKFKLTSKWRIFGEAFNTYLNWLKGTSSKIPLNYVIWDNEVPNPNVIYAMENETLIQNAALNGVQYDRDNERVAVSSSSLSLKDLHGRSSSPKSIEQLMTELHGWRYTLTMKEKALPTSKRRKPMQLWMQFIIKEKRLLSPLKISPTS